MALSPHNCKDVVESLLNGDADLNSTNMHGQPVTPFSGNDSILDFLKIVQILISRINSDALHSCQYLSLKR